MECFTDDFLRLFRLNDKICLFGGRLGTRNQIQALEGFS